MNLWPLCSSQRSTNMKHMESWVVIFIPYLWPRWRSSEGLSGLTGRQWGSARSHRNNALIGQKQEVDKQYLSSGFLLKLHLFCAANLQRDAKQHSCLCSYHWGSFISKQCSDLLTHSTSTQISRATRPARRGRGTTRSSLDQFRETLQDSFSSLHF